MDDSYEWAFPNTPQPLKTCHRIGKEIMKWFGLCHWGFLRSLPWRNSAWTDMSTKCPSGKDRGFSLKKTPTNYIVLVIIWHPTLEPTRSSLNKHNLYLSIHSIRWSSLSPTKTSVFMNECLRCHPVLHSTYTWRDSHLQRHATSTSHPLPDLQTIS